MRTNSASHKEVFNTIKSALSRSFPLDSVGEHGAEGMTRGFFNRFLAASLSQREERTLDYQKLLGTLMALPHDEARYIVRGLNPEYRYHRALLCGDILSPIASIALSDIGRANDRLEQHDAQRNLRAFDHYYQGLMRPFLVAIHDCLVEGSRLKQLPNGFLQGRQGELNSLVLMEQALSDRSLRQQITSIGPGTFDVQYFKEHRLAGSLYTVFANSPTRALLTYFHQHRLPSVRRLATHLAEEHIPLQNEIWTSSSKPADNGIDSWEYSDGSNMWHNKGLARVAVGQVVEHLIGNPSGRPLPSPTLMPALEKLITEITEDDFNSCKVRFNRTFGGVVPCVYQGSLPAAIIDYLHHHPREEVRDHFQKLRPYHFARINSWHDADGNPKRELAREALHEAMDAIARQHPLDIFRVPEQFRSEWLKDTRFFCGLCPLGVLERAYGYPLVTGILDYLKHHPDRAVANHYQGLKPRHFSRVSNGLWSMEIASVNLTADIPEGWEVDSERSRWVNRKEARETVGELVLALTSPTASRPLHIQDLPTELSLEHFDSTKLAYNSSARSMLEIVYRGSPVLAIYDYIRSPAFEVSLSEIPHVRDQVREMGGLEPFRSLVIRQLHERRTRFSLPQEPML